MAEFDLFISYSHIDNLPLAEGQEGWITRLHQALGVRVSQLVGREVGIWRDPKLQGNDFFADEIVDKFDRVAALLVVLTPRYVQSEWCLKELAAFLAATERGGGARVGDKSRVFKVVKTQIPREAHPPELKGLLGYEFFTLDKETGRPRELSLLGDAELQRSFWMRLDDLAQDLAQLLGQLETDLAPESKAPDGGKRVFLAETAFDLREERDALKRDLQQHGHQVLPAAPLPLVANELLRAVGASLEGCDLAVHLIGRSYGVVPDGETRSVLELQNQLALELSRSQGLRRLIWLRSDLEIEDARQQSLVTSLRNDPEAQAGADLLETSIEELKAAIHKRLAPPPEPEARSGNGRPAAAGSDQPTRVYLVCEQRDLDDVDAIGDYLFEQGLEVILPVFEGDEAEVRLDHQENLKLCEAVLLYYGAAQELWLRAKLRELQKIAGYGRSEPMRAKAIYVAAPANPSKQRLRTREAMVLDALAGFSPGILEPFVQELAR